MKNDNCKFFKQKIFNYYIKQNYSLELDWCRTPDEAYIINDKKLIIIEKKNQNVNGSVEDKLWTGPIFKEEYEIIFKDIFEIQYIYCVSSFLQKKIESTIPKYLILNRILKKNNIIVLYGDDEDYFEKLNIILFENQI